MSGNSSHSIRMSLSSVMPIRSSNARDRRTCQVPAPVGRSTPPILSGSRPDHLGETRSDTGQRAQRLVNRAVDRADELPR